MTGKRAATIAIAVLIATAATLPVGAAALPRRSGIASTQATGTIALTSRQSRADLLAARIAKVLQRRKVRFDIAKNRIEKRITRVGQLADKVAAAGGNATEARSALSRAQEHLSQSEALEAQTVAAFKAIPDAEDKRAAFAAARAIGRDAIKEMKAARTELRASASALRRAVQVLKTSSASDGGASRG
jgi:hypothetical protein